jgi:hypothetical protein
MLKYDGILTFWSKLEVQKVRLFSCYPQFVKFRTKLTEEVFENEKQLLLSEVGDWMS